MDVIGGKQLNCLTVHAPCTSVLKNGVCVKGSSVPVCSVAEGGFGAGEGFDEEGVTGGDGEGGAWDVEDEDLELPPDLVSFALSFLLLSLSVCLVVCLPGFLLLCWSACVCVCLCTCLGFYISASLLCLSVCLSYSVLAWHFTSLPVYLCVSVCLSFGILTWHFTSLPVYLCVRLPASLVVSKLNISLVVCLCV